MADTTVTNAASTFSPKGLIGQKYLASGAHIATPLWEGGPPGKPKAVPRYQYEIAGFVIKGTAQLEIESQTVLLEPGNPWALPKGALPRSASPLVTCYH